MRSSSRLVGASVAAGVLLVAAQVCPLAWPAHAVGAELPRAFGSLPPLSAAQTVSPVKPVTVIGPLLTLLGPTLLSESFAETAVPANAWFAAGAACLTAGSSAAPSSIPACSGTPDAVGQGVLRLTTRTASLAAMVVSTSAVSTVGGLQITFSDYAYPSPAADGIVLFLADGSGAVPKSVGQNGGALGYASGATTAGIPGAYLGIGLDEFGNFSAPSEGRQGGPGRVPETIAVRGAASTGYAYLGGAQNAEHQPASLPFTLDQTSTSRPANGRTIRATLSAAGDLDVAIDRHDGNGFVTYYTQHVVGVAGQPALPATVYIGVAAATGSLSAVHAVGGLVVSSLAATGTFTPPNVPNLAAWYDASDTATITQSGGTVSAWQDRSGNGNTLAPPVNVPGPTFTAAGIAGLGSVTFNGMVSLVGSNQGFSTQLFNASTVFAVSNQTTTSNSTLLWSGTPANPHWALQPSASGKILYDLNDGSTGRLTASGVPTGAAQWTASGSVNAHAQVLAKNGNVIASGSGPTAAASANYPLVVGATYVPNGASALFTGQIGEILVYNRALTTGEIAEVQGYLGCKWGLQNLLPANHPYAHSCPQGGAPASPAPTPTPVSGALVEPPQLSSTNGTLTLNVTANNSAGGTPQFVYNGQPVLPTLRLNPGDTLVVNLVNALPAPPSGATYRNDVSLHYHGLHVSPNAPADDSIDMLAQPGQTLHYQLTIPTTHPPGLYWYHSHAHGEAERQNLAGMSGAIVIEGIAGIVPAVAQIPERIFLVRDAVPSGQALPGANALQLSAMDWAMANGARMSPLGAMAPPNFVADIRPQAKPNPFVVIDPNFAHFMPPSLPDSHCNGSETAAKVWTVNGQTLPSIGIRPGEQQFWRMVNAGSDTYLDVAVDNAQLQIVAVDGIALASTGVTSPMTESHWVLPPASRVEFLVTGPAAGTTSYLRTNCFDSGPAGPAMPAATLAPLDPTHSPTDLVVRRAVQQPSPLMTPVGIVNVGNILKLTPALTQSVSFSDQNTINGVSYDPNAPPLFYAQSGTTQEWTVYNMSSQVHTFHIHQIHFVVETINGVKQSPQLMMDNVNVPPATANGPGTVTLRMDFSDPLIIGTFLLHCHILAHEDGGMMAKIRVGTAPPIGLSPSSVTFAKPTAPAQQVTISGGQAPYTVTGCGSVATGSISGSTLTVKPTAPGGCVLVVADSSGITGPLSVTVTALPSPIAVSPKSIGFAGSAAVSQPVTIVGGTAPFTTSGCSGIASAAVSSSTVTVTPSAVGICALTVSDAANDQATLDVSVNGTATPQPGDNVTFHRNTARNGWYKAETTLTTTNVASSHFGLVKTLSAPSTLPAFGKVYAQPLYVTGETVSGTSHNLVIVSTSTAQVYAFDDATYAVVWHRDFTNAASQIRQQEWGDTGCSDVNPDVGIISTPVIDRALDRMFVVVATMEGSTPTPHLRLHAIALTSGDDVTTATEVSGSVTVSGTTYSTSPLNSFSRSALLEANGNVYVALASHCDYQTSTTHGWLLSYNASTLANTGNLLNTTNQNDGTDYFLGSVWMGGFGPAADPQGNVYFATGNGPYNGTTNFAMSVMKVPGNLDLQAANVFTPATAAQDSGADADLASGGVMLLPDQTTGSYPRLLVQGGKCSAVNNNCFKYLLNRDLLGGQEPNDSGAVWRGNIGGGTWGGPAYFADASAQYIVYGGGTPLATYTLALSPPSLTQLSAISSTIGCLECRDSGSQPVISSNGTTTGTAIVWALKTPGGSGGTITLYAFDAHNMGTTLFNGPAGTWTWTPGTAWIGGALVSPLVANGKVYVPSDGSVAVFGLH